jgi:tRNA(fMet)-specific endonuclease VapC
MATIRLEQAFLDGHRLEHQGRPSGALDMFIAARALALDVILATDNECEFERVPSLRLANWVQEV